MPGIIRSALGEFTYLSQEKKKKRKIKTYGETAAQELPKAVHYQGAKPGHLVTLSLWDVLWMKEGSLSFTASLSDHIELF